MINCPNCRHQEPDGAIFCSECGMQMVRPEGQDTQNIWPEPDDLGTAPILGQVVDMANVWISLHLLDNGQILSISDRAEFTLGRISENQPIMPDVDLTPYHAFDHGVSRLHAVIRRVNGSIHVMDLGSSNGTYLNGARLAPNTDTPLKHGDILAFGKLKIQVILNI
jgi:pSer/pThr/pTyr-binding forkhead associated (FHA) protein